MLSIFSKIAARRGLIALTLTLLSTSHALAAPAPQLEVTSIIPVQEQNQLSLWVRVENTGNHWSESFEVALFAHKYGDWIFCPSSSVLKLDFHVPALDQGEYTWLHFIVPGTGWMAYPGRLFLVVDATNLNLEVNELNNNIVIDVLPGNPPQTSWSFQYITTPNCVLQQLDPIFTLYDSKLKPVFEAEILN